MLNERQYSGRRLSDGGRDSTSCGAQVINFPQRPPRDQQSATTSERTVIDTAFQVHEYVRLAWEKGASTSIEKRCGALQSVLHERYGAELSALAEGYFEMVYGCDPYTFLTHVDSCRTP